MPFTYCISDIIDSKTDILVELYAFEELRISSIRVETQSLAGGMEVDVHRAGLKVGPWLRGFFWHIEADVESNNSRDKIHQIRVPLFAHPCKLYDENESTMLCQTGIGS